ALVKNNFINQTKNILGYYMRKHNKLALLLELLRFGCIKSPRKIRKVDVASNLGISAWTLNRWIAQCIKDGLIEEISDGQNKFYRIKEKGLLMLLNVRNELSKYFSDYLTILIKGVVITGLGEGKYYMSIREYREGFRKALGFYPYPGTLNLKLDEEAILKKKILEQGNGIIIQGFQKSGRSFCKVKCYKALIMRDEIREYGGVLLIEKTKHPENILEVIAPCYLREKMFLEDGDIVEVLILQ
ncbi:MAG: hypothetical protein B6U94_07325, partial [Thermofilum sp. ex4484_79]